MGRRIDWANRMSVECIRLIATMAFNYVGTRKRWMFRHAQHMSQKELT